MSAADLILPAPAEGSREIAGRVARARDVQARRYEALGLPGIRVNAQAHGPALDEVARLDTAGLALIRDAADAMRLSARGYHRVLRVARTLADLDGMETIGRVHLAEALSYRALADEVRRAARSNRHSGFSGRRCANSLVPDHVIRSARMVGRYELSEAQWRRIGDLLPGKAGDPGRTGARRSGCS